MPNNKASSSNMMMYMGIAFMAFLAFSVLFSMGFVMGGPKKYRSIKGAVESYDTNKPSEVPEDWRKLCKDDPDIKEFASKLNDYKDSMLGKVVKTIQGDIENLPPCPP